VRLLLDTHAFLWFITNDPQLSATANALIGDVTNEVFVSPATYFEVAIKVSIKKYPLSSPFETFITKGIAGNGFKILPIEVRHAAVLSALPFPPNHKDPFDRLIVSQAISEQMSVVSADTELDNYPVTRLW
jgi:PIN domain nuclease of toxin-antitoxin system